MEGGGNSIIKVKTMRFIGGKETSEEHYYISSLPVNSPFSTNTLSHWEVENNLYWTLDMNFGEDHQRKQCKKAAENFSLIRKFALNILKKDNPKLSLVNKRLKAAWNWTICYIYYKFDAFALPLDQLSPCLSLKYPYLCCRKNTFN